VAMLYGLPGVTALILSSLGAEMALWSLGMFIIGGHSFRAGTARRLFSPPLIALALAVFISWARHVWGGGLPETGTLAAAGAMLLKTIETVGAATVPVAMIIAGSGIAGIQLAGLRNPRVWLLSGLRLVVIPLLAIAGLRLLPLPIESLQVLTVVAVMPVSIISISFSKLYPADGDFVAGTVLLTHALALATVPLLLWLLLPG